MPRRLTAALTATVILGSAGAASAGTLVHTTAVRDGGQPTYSQYLTACQAHGRFAAAHPRGCAWLILRFERFRQQPDAIEPIRAQ